MLNILESLRSKNLIFKLLAVLWKNQKIVVRMNGRYIVN